jgi:hypothetical protein
MDSGLALEVFGKDASGPLLISYSPLHRRSGVSKILDEGAIVVKGVGETSLLLNGWTKKLEEHGIFSLEDGVREKDISMRFSELQIDVPSPLAIRELENLYDERGTLIPSSACKLRPCNYYYRVQEPIRICDIPFLDSELRSKAISRNLSRVAPSVSGGSNAILTYVEKFVEKLARASGNLHLEGFHNAGIWEHNITMAGELLDFEQAYHPAIKSKYEFYNEDIAEHQDEEVLKAINACNYLSGLLATPLSERRVVDVFVSTYRDINSTNEMINHLHTAWRTTIRCLQL